MKLLFTLCFLLSTTLQAETKLYLGLYTDHLVSGSFNESNNLVAIQKNSATFAFFKNSYHNDSFAVSTELKMKPDGSFRFGTKAGLATGYEKGAIPFLAPWVEYGNFGVILFGGAVTFYVFSL